MRNVNNYGAMLFRVDKKTYQKAHKGDTKSAKKKMTKTKKYQTIEHLIKNFYLLICCFFYIIS